MEAVKVMKKQLGSCLAVLILVTALTACTTSQRKDTGMIAGGVLGGVAGSALTGGSTAGTIAGAVGGGYIGRQLTQ
jgi:osmotically inducible lipoprotein OsmB